MDFAPNIYACFNFCQYLPAFDLQDNNTVKTMCQGEILESVVEVIPIKSTVFIEGHKVDHFFVLGMCPNCRNLIVGEAVVHPGLEPVMLVHNGKDQPPFNFSIN